MKIVFMGTPDFAVPVLEGIIKAGYEVGYVITQPDKAKNRGKKVQFTPVKELALAHKIAVLQPEKIKKDAQTVALLKDYAPDVIVVVAYGQIIQREGLHQCSCITAGEAAGCFSYTACNSSRGGKDWRNHHADERRP